MEREPDQVANGSGGEEVIQIGGHSYVLALSSRVDERTRVLKSGETFAVFDRQADIVRSGMGDQGLYHNGMRHLSRLDLLVDGRRPLLLSSALEDEDLMLVADLT